MTMFGDLAPFWLSLRVASIATLLIVSTGLIASYLVLKLLIWWAGRR